MPLEFLWAGLIVSGILCGYFVGQWVQRKIHRALWEELKLRGHETGNFNLVREMKAVKRRLIDEHSRDKYFQMMYGSEDENVEKTEARNIREDIDGFLASYPLDLEVTIEREYEDQFRIVVRGEYDGKNTEN